MTAQEAAYSTEVPLTRHVFSHRKIYRRHELNAKKQEVEGRWRRWSHGRVNILRREISIHVREDCDKSAEVCLQSRQ